MKIAILILTLLLMFVYNGCGQPTSIGQAVNNNGCTISTSLPPQDYAPNGGSVITCYNNGIETQTLIVNGATFTSIQFCPGVTPTYPTTFPEVGFCINGNLYAVYSANNGFLTVISPGYYDSNAIGSSCSFTVVAGCGVSN
jgi:hypothetical protein